MALVNHNATLEYAANELEFWLIDDAGAPEDFDTTLTFSVERIDDSEALYTNTTTSSGNYVKFSVNIDKDSGPTGHDLHKAGDSIYEYDHPVYEHIYSVKSSTKVYISGKLNLVEIAGV